MRDKEREGQPPHSRCAVLAHTWHRGQRLQKQMGHMARDKQSLWLWMSYDIRMTCLESSYAALVFKNDCNMKCQQGSSRMRLHGVPYTVQDVPETLWTPSLRHVRNVEERKDWQCWVICGSGRCLKITPPSRLISATAHESFCELQLKIEQISNTPENPATFSCAVLAHTWHLETTWSTSLVVFLCLKDQGQCQGPCSSLEDKNGFGLDRNSTTTHKEFCEHWLEVRRVLNTPCTRSYNSVACQCRRRGSSAP